MDATPSPDDVMSYVAQSAGDRGIDPRVATQFFRVESGFNPTAAGDSNSSFGVAQLHYGGISRASPHPGLGDRFTADTGLDARDPSNWKASVDYALDTAKREGWGAWANTRDKLGYSNTSGGAGVGGSAPKTASSTDFLTDFPLAAQSGVSFAPATETPAASAPSTGGAEFLTDFPLAKATAASAPVAPAVTAPVPSTPIGVNDSARAIATGVPVVGGLLNKADAALDAAVAPVFNGLFDPKDQLRGKTFADRYQNALAIQNGMDASFAQQHPVANTALNLTGSVLGTGAEMRMVPAAFGVTSAGLLPNMLLGGAGGATLGTADAAIRSGGDPSATKWGAAGGAFLGGAAPAAGALVGAGVRGVTNALAGTTPGARTVADALGAIGMTPEGATNALAQMGPHATLADIDPALTQTAGGLARMGGAPTSILKGVMNERSAGASARMSDAVDQYLGPRPDLTATEQAYRDAADSNASPFYQAARNTAAHMDIQPIVSDIDSRIAKTTGGVRKTLETARDYLVNDVPGIGQMPKSDPQELLGARQALDDFIEKQGDATTSAGRNAIGAAKDVRSNLNAVLKQDPNIAAGDQAYSSQMRNLDALQQGQDLFKNGTRIEDVQRSIASMSPEQLRAMRQGALVSIHDAMDNARQGEFSAARSLFAKATANRAKLDALFPNSSRVLDILGAETTMRGTESQVAHNSVTAGANAIMQKFAPAEDNALSLAPAVVGHALGGDVGAVSAMGAKVMHKAISNALSEGARQRLIEGTARGLSALGPAQQAFMDQVGRAYRTSAASNALASGASNAANLLTRVGGNALAQRFEPAY